MRKRGKYQWLLLTPIMLIMILLVIYPIIRTLMFSLYRLKLTEPNDISFIGLQNYAKVFKSHDFYYSLQNSLLILFFVIVLTVVSSLAVGLLLNKKTRLSPLLTAIAIVPWALPPLINGIIWKFIFHPGYGLMNKLLIMAHITDAPISWTTDRIVLMLVVSIVVSWRVVPFCAIIVLANLQNIPGELYEAARVDGSSSINTFFKITLPILVPSMSIILIQTMMAAMNVFDEITAISGFRFDGMTLLLYNYLNTFSFLDFGYGSAITYVIMIISGIIGFFYIKNASVKEV